MNARDGLETQFYPTPPALAARAWAKFRNREFVRVLEPQAGHGDLAVAHPDYGGFRTPPIDCCEIDIGKHGVLRGKRLNVVGFDFLEFGNGSFYSHIISNPPFSEGAAHVLKAWDILWDGEIVAILNAETVRNPFSCDRQTLLHLIERCGEVEFVEGAFAVPQAQRKTDVDVALVYLRKQADLKHDIIGDLLAGLHRDGETPEGLGAGYAEHYEVALPNSVIENSVAAFNAAVRTMREAVFGEARASYYACLLGETMAVRNGDGPPAPPAVSVGEVHENMAKRYEALKDRAWAGILRSTNVTARLSSAAQKRVESEFAQVKSLEFTVPNVYGFLCGLASAQGQVQIEMACDVFDLITKYYSENTVFYRGWKSNDKHRTCGMRIKTTRFVLPGHSGYSYSLSWESNQLLADFDKVFAMLDGKHEPEVGLVRTFDEHYQALRDGARMRSSYFDVRYYPGIGSIHFFPRDKTLVDRLNRLVGRQRKWLPPEGTPVSDAFWLQFDNAEKLDKAVRAEVNRSSGRSSWDHPLRGVFQNDSQRRGAAAQAIDQALAAVQQRNGICADWLIADADHEQRFLVTQPPAVLTTPA